MRAFWLLGVLLIPVLTLAACSSGGRSSLGFDQTAIVGAQSSRDADFSVEEGAPQLAIAMAKEQAEAAAFAADAGGGEGGDGGLTQIPVDRKVISSGSLFLQVEDVRAAAANVRAVAEALGGFVEQLSVSGNDDFADGFVVVRVPQEQFFTAIERIGALGEVLSESLGSKDVTAQFVDLDARLRSLQAEEARLVELLQLADGVSDILVLERELARVRTDIERFQGQLNFLVRQVALSTISVNLVPPRGVFTEPPSASLTMEAKNVEAVRDTIRQLAEAAGGGVTSSSLQVEEDFTSATIQVLIPRDEFGGTLISIERLGDVLRKGVSEEGESPIGKDVIVEQPQTPDAPIAVFVLEKESGADTALIAGLAGGLGGGALLLALLGGALVLARRRRA